MSNQASTRDPPHIFAQGLDSTCPKAPTQKQVDMRPKAEPLTPLNSDQQERKKKGGALFSPTSPFVQRSLSTEFINDGGDDDNDDNDDTYSLAHSHIFHIYLHTTCVHIRYKPAEMLLSLTGPQDWVILLEQSYFFISPPPYDTTMIDYYHHSRDQFNK